LRTRTRRLWWIIAVFLAVQVYTIWFAANGPFVDEGLYAVAGMRVLEGKGLSDGYVTWFNGSPFVWPVIAVLGHHLGGLPGARLMAASLSAVTLWAFAKTAEIGCRAPGMMSPWQAIGYASRNWTGAAWRSSDCIGGRRHNHGRGAGRDAGPRGLRGRPGGVAPGSSRALTRPEVISTVGVVGQGRAVLPAPRRALLRSSRLPVEFDSRSLE